MSTERENAETEAPGYVAPELALVGDEHVKRYEETDGVTGYSWNGVHCLVLTTTGRVTHQAHKCALIFGEDGENCVVIASKGGAPEHPEWFRNISADPNVHVQVKERRFAAVAEPASGGERERLWQLMADIWPNYNVYVTRTDREIPVVVLKPVAG